MRAKCRICYVSILIILVLLILGSCERKYNYLKQVTTTDGFEIMGQVRPAMSDTVEIWFSEKMGRANLGDSLYVIVDMEKELMYVLNKPNRAYFELSLDAVGNLEMMLGDSSDTKQMLESMQGMMSMLQISATVTPTEETKNIKGWNCKKYLIAQKVGFITINQETWATADIDVDYDMLRYLTSTQFNWMPGYKEASLEMNKIKGIGVLVEGTMNMMGNEVKTSTELIEVDDMDIPKDLYNIPDDFQKIAFRLPQMGQ